MKFRVVSKARFTAFLLVLVMIMVMITGLVFRTVRVNGESAEKFQVVQVMDGDTLWTLAEKYTPKDQDVRRTIYEIRKANGMETSDLSAGQILKIPADLTA